jgi:outer membrane protein assembly factor BamB
MKRHSRLTFAFGLGALGLGVYAMSASTGRSPTVVAQEKSDAAVAPAKDASAGKSDLLMFGGSHGRNFVNTVDTGVMLPFSIEKDLKWKAQLGSRAYGGPLIHKGKVLVGTNNENPRNKRDRGKATDDNPMGRPLDKGVVMCFNESDGKFVWQGIHDKLESGQVNDWPFEGVCSSGLIEGDKFYYVTNRCEVVCADLNGFANGNDGFQGEKYKDATDADILWSYDMIKELKVFPHNMSACSPLIAGDLLFIITANGVDENHNNIPFPEAPSFLCLNKNTGKVLWKSNLPGKAIMHGQWANMCYGVIQGKPQVIFPGGDGWLYSLEPETGNVIWKFDANPKDSKYELGGKGTRSDFIGTPVIFGDQVFIGTGQDPEHFEGIGHFWCIDATKKGDISPDLVSDAKADPPKTQPNPNSGAVWHYGGVETKPYSRRDYVYGRTMSSACIVDGIIYISELAGYVHCLDLKTGRKYWQFDTKSAIWGSCYFVDGKVLLANEDGDMYVFKHEKTQEVMDEVAEGSEAGKAAADKAKADGADEAAIKKAGDKASQAKAKAVQKKVSDKFLIEKIEIGEAVRSTPVVINGTVYVLSEKSLFAIGKK